MNISPSPQVAEKNATRIGAQRIARSLEQVWCHDVPLQAEASASQTARNVALGGGDSTHLDPKSFY